MVKIFLKPGKEIPVLRFHPWVFSGAIAHIEGNPADGDVAEVYSRRGELLGAGHFHHGSIAVRLLSFGEADLGSARFWEEKLWSAWRVRASPPAPLHLERGVPLAPQPPAPLQMERGVLLAPQPPASLQTEGGVPLAPQPPASLQMERGLPLAPPILTPLPTDRGATFSPPMEGLGRAYRLVHGEGDGLSGLVIDVYGSTAVVQCHSIGMHRQRGLITAALRAILAENLTAVYDKSAETLPPKYAENQSNGYIWSSMEHPASTAMVEENGVYFKVDWATGQKTGFFLDQRDNRHLLAQFAPGKTILNTFCYTGGFSCYALKAGASLVHSVDISAKAMELAVENAALNAPCSGSHECFTDDVLRFLKNTEQRYEVIVVDPPAYAKSLEKRHNAVQGYKRLNEEAIKKVAPGGILFTFSCSQVVDRELFYHTMAAAAMEVGRPVRVLHHLSQSADHPVSLFHPEGSYLKGLVLHIE